MQVFAVVSVRRVRSSFRQTETSQFWATRWWSGCFCEDQLKGVVELLGSGNCFSCETDETVLNEE